MLSSIEPRTENDPESAWERYGVDKGDEGYDVLTLQRYGLLPAECLLVDVSL